MANTPVQRIQEQGRAPDYMRLLPDDVIRTIAGLEYLARQPMEGLITGRHKSPHKGFSTEFAEHRQYVPGDDLRALDWRVYGRTDRYYVKEFTEETNLRATILVDASASMAYTGDRARMYDGVRASKFDCARRLAAMLTYLLVHQQDAVGLVSFDRDIRRYLPARSHGAQLRRILEHLHDLEPGETTDVGGIFHTVAERIPKRGLVIVISDLFDDPDAITKALHHFQFRLHEVLVFHVMADEEIHFPFSNFSDFHDLEDAIPQLPVNPAAVRAQYLEQIRNFIDSIEKECGRMKTDYVPVNTKDNVTDAFAAYLTQRHRTK